MIIGNGMIARAFGASKYDVDAIIFASGVSNSNETSVAEFNRERNLLERCVEEARGRRVVYFSSCALINKEMNNIPYYMHKYEMENYVRNTSKHVIVRLPQIIGRTDNPHTILTYFKNKLESNEEVIIHANAYRYFISIDDLVIFVTSLLSGVKHDVYVDFSNPYRYSAESIYLTIAKILGNQNPCYRIVEGGVSYELDFSDMYSYLQELNLDFEFGEDYFYNKLYIMLDEEKSII